MAWCTIASFDVSGRKLRGSFDINIILVRVLLFRFENRFT